MIVGNLERKRDGTVKVDLQCTASKREGEGVLIGRSK